MGLTIQQVQHVAELARLNLTETEAILFQEQLSAILEYAARLDELETDAISPTASVLPLHTVMRADKVQASFPRKEMLANAPDTMEGYIRVKAVLDGDSSA